MAAEDTGFRPCPGCGSDIPPPISTCPFCGGALETGGEAAPSAPAEVFDVSAPIDPAALETLHRDERRRKVRGTIGGAALALVSVAVVAAVFAWRSGSDAEPTDTGPERAATPTRLSMGFSPDAGDCIDFTESGEVEKRSCDEVHDYEVFAVLQHPAAPDARWPGEDSLNAYGSRCEGEPFTGYVGIGYERSSLGAWWTFPVPEDWSRGERDMMCLLGWIGGDRLTEPLRGSGSRTALAASRHFTAADLPGIVLQTYEAPAGTEHGYSMAMSADEFLAVIEAEPEEVPEVTSAYWAMFATPGLEDQVDGDPLPARAASYAVSAKTFTSSKRASMELHGALHDVEVIAGDLTELQVGIGDDAWAVATSDGQLTVYSCYWRTGNLLVFVSAEGPAADPAVMLEMAEAMAARAAGAEAPPRPAPATEAERAVWEADAALIAVLFEGEAAAWAESAESGARYAMDHAYPQLGVTVEACMQAWFSNGLTPGRAVDYAFDPAAVRRDDGWTLPDGKLAGQPIEGRIYEVEVTATVTEDGVPQPAQLNTIHAAIVDGVAYGFPSCDP